MSIEVLEPAPDKLLTTLAKVKLTMGITSDETDEVLEDMIAAASSFVMRYTGRDFALQTVKESLEGKGLPRLMISLTPIVDVDKIELDDSVIEGWTIEDREAGFIQRAGGFMSTNLPFGTIDRFPSPYGEKRWHITYSGGYVLPNWGVSQGYGQDEVNLPADLQRAVIDMVRSQFSKRRLDGTMKSYRIGDTTVTWDVSNAGSGNVGALIPGTALSVLDYYRRVY